jgi:sugar O-acyltransferase (sialic acid O-acetyltransferase NeuD family)
MIEIKVPLLNANEPEARLVKIHVQDQQAIKQGDILFTIETTKAAADVEATDSGFIRIVAAENATMQVGDLLAFITATDDEPIPSVSNIRLSASTSASPSALRITKPAQALAESLGMDLATLPTDQLITESILRSLTQTPNSQFTDLLIPESPILIYGGGGHAKAVMDMIKLADQYRIVGIIDDKIKAGETVLGFPVLGTRSTLAELFSRGVTRAANGVGGIIDINARVKLFEVLEGYGFDLPAIIHPRSTVEASAEIGSGAQVFGNAYIGSAAVIKPKAMINTGAIVSHDCVIGSYTHIAPGAMLAGHVHVGDKALIGMGVTTAIGVTINDGARIGNGAVILADVPAKTIIQVNSVWAGK